MLIGNIFHSVEGVILDEEPFFGTFFGISPHHHTTPNNSHFHHILPPFSLPFPSIHPSSSLIPTSIHQPSLSLLQPFKFAIFNPSNFPLKFRHIFIGSFRLYSHIFIATSKKLIKCLQFVHIVVISL